MSIGASLKAWAKRIKRDGVTLWFAGKHPGTPWYAKALGVFVVAYALSPIDLIPDFIPVLGYVDDMLLLPALIWLTVRLLPPEVLAECRGQADAWMQANGAKPRSRFGMVLIVLIWLAVGTAAWWWLQPRL
ncbi:YkvA family protein [Comamonas badia]|uniref:YkvA family protein n=1 Tax=Comamonas badia TaxID=265291 RepID=UPI000A055B5B|nr:YkvA family protein [Comamonas badia]